MILIDLGEVVIIAMGTLYISKVSMVTKLGVLNINESPGAPLLVHILISESTDRPTLETSESTENVSNMTTLYIVAPLTAVAAALCILSCMLASMSILYYYVMQRMLSKIQ